MRDGKLLAMDTPQNLKERVVPGDVWEVYAEPLESGLAALHQMQGILRVGLAGDHIRAITERGEKKDALLGALRKREVHVSSVMAGEPTLEDVFLSLAR
jgi:ABC-type multidrug transport system ATPase subunit